MSEWISAKDRLPDVYTPVLVTYIGWQDGEQHCDEVATIGLFSKWHWWDGGDTEEEVLVTITHWMPLPEPPKED